MKDSSLIINYKASLKDALRKLDVASYKVLIVVDDDGRLAGALTDGDVRRGLLSGAELGSCIDVVYNHNPVSITVDEFSFDKIKELLSKDKLEVLPVIEPDGLVADFVTWDKVFAEKHEGDTGNIDCPLVVMAGGKGTRLEPFTKILPKPLIPIGDKPIIQTIADRFKDAGCEKFNFVVNYKGEMIESYFNHISDDYDIEYFWEKDFYGTAGGLKMLEGRIGEDFFVSNCDVIIKAKYENILSMHREKGAALTIVSAIQHYKIPYGVVQFQKGGKVTGIDEKPEYTFTVNTGLYVLNDRALGYIKENEFMHMTDLIDALVDAGEAVITYPVNENEYLDIGQWEEYKKSLSRLQVLDL